MKGLNKQHTKIDKQSPNLKHSNYHEGFLDLTLLYDKKKYEKQLEQ